ncbi:MAG: hypothetical protein IPG89_19285 [Bacteroidetes bacterium]|nr:hypothetical protein [Bacteroidota bacterium]
MLLSQQYSNTRFTLTIVDECYYDLKIIDNVEITIDDIKEIVVAQTKMGGKRMPTLVSSTKYAITNAETLKYISENKNFPYSSGGAFVIASVSQRLMANFYLKLNKPQRPTRFFTNAKEAVKWAKELCIEKELAA